MPARKARPPSRRNRRHGEDAAQRDRAVKALDLRIAGATYRQIGAQLGVSESTAYQDVQEELGRLDTVATKKAERLRDLEARRLDVLTVALAPGIRNGEPRAIVAAVRVMERRARLFGLDAPQKITGPEGEPVAIRIVHQQMRE
jgi:Homeodomain-like domain